MKTFLIIPCCLLLPHMLMAQVENQSIQQGNALYKQNDFVGAQRNYSDALTKNPENDAANYNLGNALYQQKMYDDAVEKYQKAAETATDPKIRADAYHNLGNALMEQKKYEESVNAYKQSLHNNPEDADTKYNLAYAQSMLKKQQQQQQQKNNKQDQQNKQQQQNKQDQQQQNKDQQQQQQDQAQQQPKQFTKDELDRIMQALNADDKNVQDKVNKQKVQAAGSGTDKDW